MSASLDSEFHEAMEETCRRAVREYGYNPILFRKMLADHKGLGAAQRLLRVDAPQYGLLRLKELGGLKISMEYTVLDPRFRELFVSRELETARQRLIDFGMNEAELGTRG